MKLNPKWFKPKSHFASVEACAQTLAKDEVLLIIETRTVEAIKMKVLLINGEPMVNQEEGQKIAPSTEPYWMYRGKRYADQDEALDQAMKDALT